MSQSDQLEISQEFIKNFWPNQDTSPEAIAAYHKEDKDFGWLEEVQTILCANQAKNLSDTELLRCTENCVCGPLLFHLGVIFREAGMLIVSEKEKEEEEMKILGEDIIHKPIPRKDTSIGRIWRYRFVPYKSGTVSHPSFTVELYHNGELVSFGASVHSLYMAALIAKDHYKRKGGVSKLSAASTLGRLGGLAKSEAKAISSRENGKKGGRPRKIREERTIETIEESNLDLFK